MSVVEVQAVLQCRRPLRVLVAPTHHEQVGNKALYFDKDSQAQLAEILETYKPLPDGERQLFADKARSAAAEDVRQFADKFCELIESVVV